MSLTLLLVVAVILLSPLLVMRGGRKVRVLVVVALAAFGLYVSLLLFGVEGRVAIRNSSLTGEALNTFAQGVTALAARIWVERAIVSAIILALVCIALMDPKGGSDR